MLLSLIHISEPTRRTPISYAVFCLKKKKDKSTSVKLKAVPSPDYIGLPNYKTCQLRMHCNWRQPDAAQSLPALISSPVPILKSLSLSVAVLERFTADTLPYAVTLNNDLVTLTFDL